MKARGMGWRIDLPHPDDVPLGSVVRSFRMEGPANLREFRGRRLYQGSGEACVAFSLSRAFRVSLATQGIVDPPIASQHFLYLNARAREYAGMDPRQRPPLVDKGCYPRLALLAAQDLGFCDERTVPYNPLTINAQPAPCAYRKAFDQKGLQWFAIDDLGDSRSDLIRACLQMRPARPVVIGLPVDGAFLEHRGSEPIDSIDLGDIRGYHMVCALEVLANGDILIDNWWDDWGFEDGVGILTKRLVGLPYVRNVNAILPVPTYASDDDEEDC